ncbi:ABC transporter ATP-binding protein [Microbacterium sp. MC2]
MTDASITTTSTTRDPEPLLSVSGLRVEFPIRSRVLRRHTGTVQAVSGLDLDIGRGETLGLIGESGCGKSTAGRAILQLIKPTAGSVKLDGVELTTLARRDLLATRRDMQIVLQDPFASLDPRHTVRSIISEPIQVHGTPRDQRAGRVEELLELVGLSGSMADRYPHEFSGGQRQRISIARALALSPKLLVLDEPLSALDVSIQAQIVNLLRRLQRETGISLLMISHDLAVVRQMCDRVAVMYLGRIVETGTVADVYTNPSHPYTQALLSAAPEPDPSLRGERARIILSGEVPRPDSPPPGCRFHTRCWRAQELCRTDKPDLIARNGAQHPSACHFATAPGEPVAVTLGAR